MQLRMRRGPDPIFSPQRNKKKERKSHKQQPLISRKCSVIGFGAREGFYLTSIGKKARRCGH